MDEVRKARRLADQEWPDEATPGVSILCMVYNHEKYLRDAIDGFLVQETTFPVEILIHNDASTDSSPTILAEYAARHPKLIRVVTQRENQYSRGNRPIPILAPLSRGKYLSICEGDDYWTSPHKLQTQYEMLEARPDASGCIHRADELVEPGNTITPGKFGPPEIKTEYSIDDLLCGENFVPTASIVLKRSILTELPSWMKEAPHHDVIFLSIAALEGPLLYSDESMSVYRKHPGGIHTSAVYATQILNSLRTLVVLGGNLGVASRPSFKTGFRFRMSELEGQVASYEASLRGFERQHAIDTRTISGIMTSRTFKLGLALSKLRDRLVGSRSKPGSSAVSQSAP